MPTLTPSAHRAKKPNREDRPIEMEAANELIPGKVIRKKNVTEIVAHCHPGSGSDYGVKKEVTFYTFPKDIFAQHFRVKEDETLKIVFPNICNAKTLADAILALTVGLGLEYRADRGSGYNDFNNSKRYVALGDFNGEILTARCVNDDMDSERYRVYFHGRQASIILNNVYPVGTRGMLEYEPGGGSRGKLSGELEALIGSELFSYRKALKALTRLERNRDSRMQFIRAVGGSNKVEITLFEEANKDGELSPRTLQIVISSGKIVYLHQYERWGEATKDRIEDFVDKRRLFQLCKIFSLRDEDIILHLKRALKAKAHRQI